MDHPPPHNIVPHYRLLLHGKDGCIPYLTPELIRLLFCPPIDCENSNKDSSSNNTNVDWKWRRQHFILGVAVKDTCISALYRTVKTTPPLVTKTKRTKEQAINENNGTKRMKKEKQQLQDDDVSTTQVVGGLDSEILSSPHLNNDHIMNTNSTIDKDPLQGKQEMGVIKKPCGYSFITPSQSNQICSNIHSHRVNSCKNGDETAVPHCYDNYMHTHLRIPQYISTMIVPTFSLDQPSNNSHVHNNDDDSLVSNHRNNGGHVSKKQPPPQTAVNARKQKKQQQQQQQQQHNKNDDGSSIIPNSTKECISVDTPHGWQKLTPIQYWDAVMSLINPIPSSVKGEIDDASSATSSSSSCVGAVGLFDHFGLSRNRINDVIFAVEESSNDDVVKTNDNNDNDINDNNKPSSAHHHHHPFAGKCGTLLQRVVQRTNGWSHCITRYRDTAATTAMTPLIEFWTPIHLTASRLPLDYLLSCPRNVHNIKSDVKSQASILSNCCNVAIVGWDAVSYSRERKRQALHDLISTLSPPRQYAVLSVNNLHSILDAVKEGVSIVGTDIVRHWSCSGKALCLDLTRYNNNDDGPQDVTSVDKSTGGLLDLKGEQYAQDARVLIPGCKYIVGPSFSRAYIHHLIKAKEMLAEILLFVHNLNQMLLLMRQLSKSVDDNNLETYCNWIEDQL